MARIPEIVDRLVKWQEWYFSSMSCGIKSPSLHVRVVSFHNSYCHTS